MDHDRFIGLVQHRARLASRGQAERVIRATLETLAERLSGGAAGNLAAQLPHEIGEHLLRHAQPATGGVPFGLDGFLVRVMAREGGPAPTAVFHARAVLEVTEQATTGALMTKVRQQIPAEFDPLFDAGSSGPLHSL